MILPTSYTLSSSVLGIGRQPTASGGSGDLYEGTLDGSRVCIKRIRIYSRGGPGDVAKVHCLTFSVHFCSQISQALYQEAVVWKYLAHPNIVTLLGITHAPLQLISEWIPGGDLTEYIKKHPDAGRLDLVGVPPAVFDPSLTPTTSCLMSPKVSTISTLAT